MRTRPVLPLVISMALPMTISMLVNALYNIVDSFFVAKISDDAMTALSLVYPIQNLMMATTVGFGIGINAMIAYFLGAKKKKKRIFPPRWEWFAIFFMDCCLRSVVFWLCLHF